MTCDITNCRCGDAPAPTDQYPEVGRLVGRFYTDKGKPTAAHTEFQACVRTAAVQAAHSSTQQKLYPTCSSRWAQGEGGQVWCDADAADSSVGKRVPRKIPKSPSGTGAYYYYILLLYEHA